VSAENRHRNLRKQHPGGTDLDTNEDILLGKWHQLKGQVRQRWGKLTDDDFIRLSGKTEELAGVLQQRYGYGSAQAKIEINNWLSEHDRAR
jgi:uncharacterized protein YjbJ (UPF0337 family)